MTGCFGVLVGSPNPSPLYCSLCTVKPNVCGESKTIINQFSFHGNNFHQSNLFPPLIWGAPFKTFNLLNFWKLAIDRNCWKLLMPRASFIELIIMDGKGQIIWNKWDQNILSTKTMSALAWGLGIRDIWSKVSAHKEMQRFMYSQEKKYWQGRTVSKCG